MPGSVRPPVKEPALVEARDERVGHLIGLRSRGEHGANDSRDPPIWVFTGGRELLSTVASQDGWAFVGGVAYVIFYVLFMAVVSLMSLTSIVLPVWEDSFGPKRKSQSDPATSSLTTVSHAFGANPNGTVS